MSDEKYDRLRRNFLKTGRRPKLRPDGIVTRCDMQFMSEAELSITAAMRAVEMAGASTALTDAVTLLGKARDRVADHVESVEE